MHPVISVLIFVSIQECWQELQVLKEACYGSHQCMGWGQLTMQHMDLSCSGLHVHPYMDDSLEGVNGKEENMWKASRY